MEPQKKEPGEQISSVVAPTAQAPINSPVKVEPRKSKAFQAYLATLEENQEVYRRLADS